MYILNLYKNIVIFDVNKAILVNQSLDTWNYSGYILKLTDRYRVELATSFWRTGLAYLG